MNRVPGKVCRILPFGIGAKIYSSEKEQNEGTGTGRSPRCLCGSVSFRVLSNQKKGTQQGKTQEAVSYTHLYLIGVKYKNDSAFSKALIVAQNIRQRLPGGVQAGACQFF